MSNDRCSTNAECSDAAGPTEMLHAYCRFEVPLRKGQAEFCASMSDDSNSARSRTVQEIIEAIDDIIREIAPDWQIPAHSPPSSSELTRSSSRNQVLLQDHISPTSM